MLWEKFCHARRMFQGRMQLVGLKDTPTLASEITQEATVF